MSTNVQTVLDTIQSNKPPKPSELGRFVKALIALEESPGGPYRAFENETRNARFNAQVQEFISRIKTAQPAYFSTSKARRSQRSDRYSQARKLLITMSPSFHACTLPILNKIEKADKTGEIGLLSTLFSDAVSSVGTINTKTVHDLDVANILAWVSYTMYDSVIDQEHAAPTYTIAAANAVLRLAHSLYQSIDSSDIATQLLNTVDAAMLDEQLRNRELQHTEVQLHTDFARILSSEQSKKSIAHIAGPLIISNLLDLPHQELLTRSLGTYCGVRQLLDDIYDAKGDLDRNHYTYANTKLYPSLQLNSHDPQLQRDSKRVLMSEVLTKSIEAIDALCENNDIEKDSDFTNATLGRIHTIATQALAYDAATSESIEAFIN